MTDEIVKLLAARTRRDQDLPEWAINCLEKGYDSKSLRILASMSKWDSASELDNYFQRSLRELGWNKIDREDYLLRYSKILAREIVEDRVDPISFASIICEIQRDLDYPGELHDFFEIYEMIWDYDYFLKTGSAGHFNLPHKELVGAIKRISQELLKSKEII